jgi:hypothetical protein
LSGDDLGKTFARLIRAAEGLPEVEESTSYGTPALKLRGKLMARVKDAETVVLHIAIEDKMLLMEAAPEIYYETDHYKGWAYVLVRLDAISDGELAGRLRAIWRAMAPKKLAAANPGI